LQHQPSRDKLVKLELANATTATHAPPDPRVPLVKREPMVTTVKTVPKETTVYPVTCPRCHWTPLANAFHARMDQKDPTDQSAPPVPQDLKDPTAKVALQAQMAKTDQTVMLDQPALMANPAHRDPKVTKVPTVPKANPDQLDPKERKDQPDQLAQQAQPAKMPKLDPKANRETKDQTASQVTTDQKDQPAPTASQAAQAKMPPIARAHVAARLIKPEIHPPSSSFHFVAEALIKKRFFKIAFQI